MTNNTHEPEHLSDGTLIQLIDGEAELAGQSQARHVEQCEQCRSRMHMLVTQSQQLSSLLSSLDRPGLDDLQRARLRGALRGAQSKRWRRVPLQVAAGLVIAAGIAAATPAGDWVRNQIRSLTGAVVAPDPIAPTDTIRDSQRAPGNTFVTFVPDSPTLTISLTNRVTDGSLQLSPSPDARVLAKLTQTTSGTLVVLPNALQVHNEAGERILLDVQVPASVREVRLQREARGAVQSFSISPGESRKLSLVLPSSGK